MMLREGGSGVRCGYDVMMSLVCLDDTSAMSCDVVRLVGMPHSAEHEKKVGVRWRFTPPHKIGLCVRGRWEGYPCFFIFFIFCSKKEVGGD
jgi:hypothetical protein